MNHGSLFSGIGGFDLAAQWMGWENVFHCEWNEFGQKVLKYYWPNAISYGDITKTDFTIHRGRIDILTGGFPCQPYSMAGKRLGKEDERHLWPSMLRAIREIQPTWVVGENVSGLVNWNGGMVFNEVQADLEAEGYEVIPFLLPAAGVNAPHKRERVWFVAHSVNSRHNTGRGKKDKKNGIQEVGGQAMDTREFNGTGIPSITPDTCNQRLQGRKLNETPNSGRNERGREDKRQSYKSVAEFYKGSNWEQFPIESPVCSRNDGIPSRLSGITFSKHRNESIKAYGNAIVPQVAYQIFKAIEQLNNS
jgi:DNA (cytosine-5)-methyltransferase 1